MKEFFTRYWICFVVGIVNSEIADYLATPYSHKWWVYIVVSISMYIFAVVYGDWLSKRMKKQNEK